VRSLINSVKLARDVSDGRHHVDGTTGHDHSGLSGKELSGSPVDLLAGNSVDLLGVLVEVKITESHEVASHLLKAVVLAFHGHHHVHLKDVLGAVEFMVLNGVTELGKFLHGNTEELSRVGAGALNLNAEQTGISEVRVDGRSGVNKVVLLHHVGHGTAVHSLTGAT